MSAITGKHLPHNSMTLVIAASSVGTLIEWYDFYLFGMLATIISKQFFPDTSGVAALLSTLAIFAAGFIVRPFGALVFGRIGDKVGRKYTFLLTLILMGGSTFLIGLVPGYSSIGWAAPLLVLVLRLVQGLALGGEYGGAATYVAEHSPADKRGYYTSFIQTTATLGLFLALGVIIFIRNIQGVEAFSAPWGGWRIPFYISALLVVVSIIIRMRMQESPMFAGLKKEGKLSVNPLKESFGKKSNFKMVLLALFGAVMGQGVVWYTGQFYAQSFLENVCKINFDQSRTILIWAIAFATPGFILFGWLSDKIGRKWIMLAGMLLAACLYRPIYTEMINVSGITRVSSTALTDISLKEKFVIKNVRQIGKAEIRNWEYVSPGEGEASYKLAITDTVVANTNSALPLASIPKVASITLPGASYWQMIMLVFVQIVFVTMVYGPIAAFLVELFPTRIRYTSMSLPYHIGNGIFGGMVPFIATLMVELSKTKDLPAGNPLSGLTYPIVIAAMCFVIGAIYLTNKKLIKA